MEMRCYCSYPNKPASTRSRVVLDPLRVQFTVIQFHYTIYSYRSPMKYRATFFREQHTHSSLCYMSVNIDENK